MNLVRKLIELDAETAKRIAVVGDSMTDVYVHGHLADSQDGCQKFVEKSVCRIPGGAANAARSINKWNAQIFVYDQGNIRTAKTRFLVNNKIVFRHDDDRIFSSHFARSLEFKYMKSVAFDAVLLTDYDKGFLTPEFIQQVIDLANERKIPCVADAKREPSIYSGALLKGNCAYFSKYPQANQLRNYVITRGWAEPLVSIDGRQKSFRIAKFTECVNHVGAGDCFAAHLTLALAHGFSLEDAASVAHSAGRVYVQHQHNRPPLPEEIARDFEGACSCCGKEK